jgi:hypothetical protein
MATPAAKKKGSGGFRSSPGKVFGTVEQVFDDVWWAWGTVTFGPGIRFPRNMTIVRDNGELVVIHPIVMPDAEQQKLEALGPIKHIVRLGAFHGMDDIHYKQRYGATLWAPPGVDTAEGLAVDRELVPGGALPLAGATLHEFTTSRTPETVIHLERHGGIMLACDSIQNWESTTGCSALGALMSRAMGFRGRACIGPGWRKQSEPKDQLFAADFEKLLALPWKHALGAHGAPMKDTAREDLAASVKRAYKR